MSEIELTIREAVPDDAEELLRFLKETAVQTPFLLEESEPKQTIAEQMESLAAIYDSTNNVLIIALDGEKIIGTVSIYASSKSRIEHIGDLGIVVDQEYWGIGLGSVLMEEAMYWAQESTILKRIELKVQKRNLRAQNLYKKFGFKEEAVLAYGVKIDNEYLPVVLMSCIFL